MRFINTGKTAGYINLEHVAQFSGALEGGTCWIVVAGVQGVTHMQGECCQQIQDAIEDHITEMAEMRDAFVEGR